MARSLKTLATIAAVFLVTSGCRATKAADDIIFSLACVNTLHAVQGKATGEQAMAISRMCFPEAKAILAKVQAANPNATLHQVDLGDAVIEIAPTSQGPWVIGFWWK